MKTITINVSEPVYEDFQRASKNLVLVLYGEYDWFERTDALRPLLAWLRQTLPTGANREAVAQ